MKTTSALLPAILALTLCGCAGTRIYQDAGLDTRTGIPVHAGVPHLLVTTKTVADAEKRTTAVETVATVVMLPAEAPAYFVVPKAGLGSGTTELTLNNGMLVSLNSTADAKIPETINALAALAGSIGGAVTGAKATGQPSDTKGDLLQPGLYRITVTANGTTLVRVGL